MSQSSTTPQHCVMVKLELGHRATVKKRKTSEGFTHDWVMFVRGPDGYSLQPFVDKVVFVLHETFQEPRRVVREPPYRVQEQGYAGFNMQIEIYFRNKEEPKKIIFSYDLYLRMDDKPVNNKVIEKLTFQNPTEEFRKKLLKSGGSLVTERTESTVTIQSQETILTNDSSSKKHSLSNGETTKSSKSSSSKDKSSSSKLSKGHDSQKTTTSVQSSSEKLTSELNNVSDKSVKRSLPPADESPNSKKSKKQSSSSKTEETSLRTLSAKTEYDVKSDKSKGNNDKSTVSKSHSRSTDDSTNKSKKEISEKKSDHKQDKLSKSDSTDKSSRSQKDAKKHIDRKTSKKAVIRDSSDSESVNSPGSSDSEHIVPTRPKSGKIISDSDGESSSSSNKSEPLEQKKNSTRERNELKEIKESNPENNKFKKDGKEASREVPKQKDIKEVSWDGIEQGDLKDTKHGKELRIKETHIKPVTNDTVKDKTLDRETTKTGKISKSSTSGKVSNSVRNDKHKKVDPERDKVNNKVKSSSSKDSIDVSKTERTHDSDNIKVTENHESGSKDKQSRLSNDKTHPESSSKSSQKQSSTPDKPELNEYMILLLDLQRKLMCTQDRHLLQQVVNVIEETGLYRVGDTTFDFDLCSLDYNTVCKLRRCIEAL